MTDVAHRHARRELDKDMAFVRDAWITSFAVSCFAGAMPQDLYWPVYRVAIDRLVSAPGNHIVLAHAPGDPDHLYGFIVVERRHIPVVHYLYVAQPFRGQGVARSLMAAADVPTAEPFLYTFRTPTASRVEKAWRGAKWDPLAARFRPKPKKENP